jgi:hypothetical protein
MRVMTLRTWGALTGVGALAVTMAVLAATLTNGGGLVPHETGATVAPADRVLQDSGGIPLANWSVSAIFNDGSDSATIELAIDAQGADFVVIDTEGILRPDPGLPLLITNAVDADVIRLFDDGTNGDTTAGDGVFSRSGVTANRPPVHDDGSHQLVGKAVLLIFGDGSVASTEFEPGVGVVDISFAGAAPREQLSATSFATTHAVFIENAETFLPGFASFDADQATSICTLCGLLIEQFGDVFDFIVIQTGEQVQESPSCDCQAFFVTTRNDVEGIGEAVVNNNGTVFSNFNTFSPDRLQGIIYDNRLDGSPLTHEVGHNWILGFGDSLGFGSGDGHPLATNTINGELDFELEFAAAFDGVLVGTFSDLESNGDGTFRVIRRPGEYNERFDSFELYLAGFLAADDVPPILVLEGDIDVSDLSRLVPDSVRTVTIDEVIADVGVRSPAFGAAPTDFTVGTVVVQNRPFTEAESTFFTLALRYWESDKVYDGRGTPPWKAATRGVSTLTVALPGINPVVFLPPPPDPDPDPIDTSIRTAQLAPGWNLEGWTGPNQNVDVALGAILNAIDVLFAWDGAEFLTFSPTLPGPLNSLEMLCQGEGVWTFVPGGAVVPWEQPQLQAPLELQLFEGLNLVTWGGPDGTSIAEEAEFIDGVVAIFQWDTALQRFRVFNVTLPLLLNDAMTLRDGEGIWVLVDQDSAWQQPPPSFLADAGG